MPDFEKSSMAVSRGAVLGPERFVLSLYMVVAPAKLVFVHAIVSINPPSTTICWPFRVSELLIT
jgi:hypothetical protein